MRDSYSGVVRAHILFGNVRLGGLVVELASEIFVLMMTGSSLAEYGNPGREKGQSTDFMHLGRGK